MFLSSYQQALANIDNINHRLTTDEKNLRTELIRYFTHHYPQSTIFNSRYQCLLDKHIFTINDHQEINHFYPFSMRSTNKQIILEQFDTPLYAMCAIDALGIHFTLHTKIEIKTQCEYTHHPINIIIDQQKIILVEPLSDIRVLHTDLSDISDWANNCCTQMHFFINDEALTQWLQQYGCQQKNYYNLSLQEALSIAKALFYT